MHRRTLIAAAALGLLVGCTAAPGQNNLASAAILEKTAPKDATRLADVIVAAEAFGLKALAANPAETVVFSPVSACLALGMLTAGASGVAKTQLEGLLGASGTGLARAMNAMVGVLAEYAGDPAKVKDKKPPADPLVHVANNAVIMKGYEVEQSYLDALKRWYDSGVQEADLGSASGKKVLDDWVKKNTGGLIEKSAINPRPDLRLVLQSAIVFGAQWQNQFDPANTVERPFTDVNGDVTQVKTMMAGGEVRRAIVDGWQAVELPYTAGFRSMFVLPPAGVTVGTATTDLLARLRAGLTASPIDLYVPIISSKSKTELMPLLTSLGVDAIFDDTAKPLEGIKPGGGLVVGDAVQQAVIDVAEQGTVAAAVTEIAVRETSAPMPQEEVRFDRPFLMTVEHIATGVPLFQTAVNMIEA